MRHKSQTFESFSNKKHQSKYQSTRCIHEAHTHTPPEHVILPHFPHLTLN